MFGTMFGKIGPAFQVWKDKTRIRMFRIAVFERVRSSFQSLKGYGQNSTVLKDRAEFQFW